MAEPTTRDEHITEAQRLVDDARELPRDCPDVALHLAEALVHATLAVALGQRVAEPAWTWDRNNMVHSSGKWEMEYIHSCETDEIRVRPGWYLYGADLPYRNPQVVAATVPEAIEIADLAIAHYATKQPGTPTSEATR